MQRLLRRRSALPDELAAIPEAGDLALVIGERGGVAPGDRALVERQLAAVGELRRFALRRSGRPSHFVIVTVWPGSARDVEDDVGAAGVHPACGRA